MRMTHGETTSGVGEEIAEATDADGAAEEGKPITAASRRKQESRRKLLAASRKLFVERGYHETRPQDISKAAGVGHGTFYLHFEDKLDCFLAFTEEAAGELEVFLEQHLAEARTLEDGVREILKAIFEYSDANPGVLGAALTDIAVLSTGDIGRKMPVDRWADSWAKVIDRWKAAGEVADDIDSRFAGYLILGAVKHGGAYAYRNKMPYERVIDQMTKVFVRALGVQ